MSYRIRTQTRSSSEEFLHIKKLALSIQHILDSENDVNLISIESKLKSFNKGIHDLECSITREPSSEQQKWTSRINHLQEEYIYLDKRLNQYKLKNLALIEEENRKKLFCDSSDILNERRNNYYATHLRENESLKNSIKNVEEYLEMGQSIRENIGNQDNILLQAFNKATDVNRWLGLSTTVIRLIRRREWFDKYIVYSCIFITCIVIAIMWWYYT